MRFILHIIAGLLLGGLIHIFVVFSIPNQTPQDFWQKIEQNAPLNEFHVLPAVLPGETLIAGLDPAFVIAACRFFVEDRPWRIQANIDSEFWTIAVHDAQGRNIIGFTDRSIDKKLDMIIASETQTQALNDGLISIAQKAIFVPVSSSRTIVVIRVFSEDETNLKNIAAELHGARCAPMDIE